MSEAEVAVSHLTRNQFFGEVELLGNQNAIATVRAGANPAKIAMLPKSQFCTIIEESPPTIAALKQIAQERQTENRMRQEAANV